MYVNRSTLVYMTWYNSLVSYLSTFKSNIYINDGLSQIQPIEAPHLRIYVTTNHLTILVFQHSY